MKVVLGTLNSKFIHSSLALAYLEAAGVRFWTENVMGDREPDLILPEI